MLNSSKTRYCRGFLGICAATVFMGLAYQSCKVGLGAVVDTAAPEIVITNPATNEGLYNKTFTVSGTYRDDVGVKSIDVELYRVVNDAEKLVKTYTASMSPTTADSLSGTWSCIIDTVEGGLLDSTYTIKVSGSDGTFTSTKVSRTLDIDNTPPIFFLSNPNSITSDSPAKFGSAIKIEGSASDKHTITSMNVIITDGSGVERLNKSFTGFDSNSPSVTIADYKSDNDELRQNYYDIYGENMSVGSQPYQVFVSLTDKAGNTSERVYISDILNSHVRTALGTTDYTLSDIRDLYNRTYSSSRFNGSKSTAIRNILEGSDGVSTQSAPLQISVNGNVSPTYNLSSNRDSTPQVFIGNSIIVSLNLGIDNAKIDPTTLKAFFYPADSNNPEADKKSFADSNFRDSDGKTVSTIKTYTGNTNYFIFPTEADGIEVGDKYYIIIEGSDTNGVPLSKAESVNYGFTLAFNGNAPSVEIGETNYKGDDRLAIEELASVNLEQLKNIAFFGTGSSENSLKKTEWSLSLDGIDRNVIGTDISTDGLDSNFRWNTGKIWDTIPTDVRSVITAGCYKKAVFTASFANKSGQPVTVRRVFYIDTKAPVITSSKFDNDWVNADSSYNKLVVTIDDAENKQSKISSVQYVLDGQSYELSKTGSATYSSSIDFKNIEDTASDKPLNVEVIATDNAGNSARSSAKVYIDQHKPEISLVNPLSLLDSDLNSVTVSSFDSKTYYATKGYTLKFASSDVNLKSSQLTVNGSAITLTNNAYVQSNTDGTYIYKYTAEDLAGNKTSASLTVVIDTKPPVFTLTSNNDGDSIDSPNAVFSGLITDDGVGPKEYTYTLTVGNGTPVTETVKQATSSWRLPVSNLESEGTFTIEFTGTDRLGNSSAPAKYTFFYDKEKPTLTESSIGADGLTTNDAFTLSGTARDSNGLYNNGIGAVTITDGKNLTKPVNVVNGKWEVTFTPNEVSQGTNNLTITVRDVAGKTTSETRTVKMDTNKPTITDANFDKAWANATNLYRTFTVTASDTGNGATGIKTVKYSFDQNADKGSEAWVALSKASGSTYNATIDFSKVAEASSIPVYYYAEDNAGNTTSVSSVTIGVDRTLPEIRLDNSFNNMEGVSQNVTSFDGNTYYTKGGFTLNFSATDSNTLTNTLSINGGQPLSISKEGKYNQPAIDGSYTYDFASTDAAGNKTVGSITVIIDSTAPLVTVTNAPSELVTETSKYYVKAADNKTYYTLNGKWSDIGGTGATKLEYSIDGTNWIEITSGVQIKRETGWTVDIPVQDNTKNNSIMIRATDVAGNSYKNTVASDVSYDFMAPSVELIAGFKDCYNSTDSRAAISGTSTDTNIVSVSVTATSAGKAPITENVTLSNDKTRWSFTPTATDGIWTYTIIATDAMDRTASMVNTVKVDTVAPVVTGIPESMGEYTNKDNQTLIAYFKDAAASGATYSSGIKSVTYTYVNRDGNEITGNLGKGSKTYAGDNTYLYYSAALNGLPEGDTTVTVRAEDEAGNVSDVLFTYTYHIDITAPVISDITLSTNKVNRLNKNSVTVTPIVSETGSGNKTVTLKKAGAVVVSQAVSTDGLTVALPESQIKEGSNTFTISVTDAAGNTSMEGYFDFTCDTEAPSVRVTSINANTKVNMALTLGGTVSDKISEISELTGVGVQVYEGNQWKTIDAVNITIDNDGNWNTGVIDTTKVAPGEKRYFRVVVEDDNGNLNNGDGTTDAASLNGTIVLNVDQDTDRPTITLSDVAYGATIKSKTITGKITDDDGISEFYYITKADFDEKANSIFTTPNGEEYWHKITLGEDGASWSAESYADDGETTWLFYVKDEYGTEFFTGNGAGASSGSDKLELPAEYRYPSVLDNKKSILSKDRGITFSVDTKDPDFKSAEQKFYVSDSGTAPSMTAEDWMSYDTALSAGGSKKYLYALLTAKDASGIASIECISHSAVAVGIPTTVDGAKTTILKIDVSALESGATEFTFKATDNNDRSYTVVKSVVIDNAAPSVAATYPSSDDIIASDFTARGTVSDNTGGTGVAKIYWAIPEVGKNLPALIDSNIGDTIGQWHELRAASTWSIDFIYDSASDKADKYNNFYTYANKKASGVYVYGTLEGSGYMSIPVYFYIEDKLGNHTEQSVKVYVDPEKDIPKISIISPSDGITTGGTIQAFGNASDNEKVQAVYIQLDINGDGKFDDTDKQQISAWGNYVSYTGYSEDEVVLYEHTDKTWGIKIDVTQSSNTNWNMSLNQSGEFDVLIEEAGSGKFGMRAIAQDDKGNFGRTWSDPVFFTVDAGVPTINAISLVQYENADGSGKETARVAYTSDMWLKGKWFVEAYLTDPNGLSEVYFKTTTGSSSSLNDHAVTYDGVSKQPVFVKNGTESANTEEGTVGFNFYLKWPIEVSLADSNGNISSTLYVLDNAIGSRHTATANFSVNIDNEAPGIYKTSGSKTETETSELRLMKNGATDTSIAANMLSASSVITQSDNSFSIGDSVEETGSGFERVAFYIKRNGANNTVRIYDPMVSLDKSRLDVGTDITINEDNLPVIVLEGSRDSENTFSASIATEYIRVGGIVKIGGVYRRITAVTPNAVIFDSNADVKYTSAEFVIAQIVDHITTESGKYNTTTGKWDVTNDDGDGMVESVSKSGGTYKWDASFNSKNIPDGPVEIHTVTFDKAGNMTHGYVATSVQNNRPRISKVFLGTDLNGNGKYDYASGEFVSYTTDYKENDITSGTVNTLTSSAFTAKNGLAVVPEFVGSINKGADGALKYTLVSSRDTAKSEPATDERSLLKAMTSKGDGSITGDGDTFGDVTMTVHDEGFIVLNTDSLKGLSPYVGYDASKDNVMLSFTFWDATEETVQGKDSQWAIVNVPLIIDVVDKTAPIVTINKFYWNSLTDNSIYNSRTAGKFSDLLGHIELEDDWAKSDGAKSTGAEYDADPKVSGKITITGNVYDDQRIDSLWVSYTNGTNALTMATDNSLSSGANGMSGTLAAVFDSSTGSWIVNNAIIDNGWQFAITSNTLNQNGHTVEWSLDIDTAKISGIAATDVKATVYAVDHTTSVDNRSDDAYQMDVVPYITKISTSLDSMKSNNPSVYNRTALGHYIVNGGYDKKGKYSNTPTSTAETIKVYGFNIGAEYKSLDAAGLVSGNYDVTINDVVSLNNVNNNEARGSYESELSQANYATYAYNRQPNGDNNNLLTDDVVLDVWQINNRAIKPISGRIEQPVMKINPLDGQLGFAFANGPLYFSMGGYNATSYKSSTSFDYWQGSYDFFTSIGYTIDSLGNSYGCAAGGDINSSSADMFSLYSSRWGTSDRNSDASRNGNKALRLELIAQKENGVINFNKYRILSPSMATAVHGSDTGLYMVYYDDINQQVRFRAGKITGTSVTNSNNNKNTYGNFLDDQTTTAPVAGDTNTDNVNLLAGGNTGYNAGEYCSIAVVSSEKTTVDDKVVVVWYDNVSHQLYYTYSTFNFLDTTVKGTSSYGSKGNKFETPRTVFNDSNIGEYCKIAVDKNGGIHIAAYDSINGDLKYAYAPSYNGAFTTCTVDSYGSVGSEITLDVAYSGSGNNSYAVPYIGYYSSNKKPKLAYRTSSVVADGVVNEAYTGSWECTFVPTSSTVPEDHINVGVHKQNGILANTTTSSSIVSSNETGYVAYQGGSGSDYKASAWGHIFANGTVNPIMGYQIKDGSVGYIETAQMK